MKNIKPHSIIVTEKYLQSKKMLVEGFNERIIQIKKSPIERAASSYATGYQQ
jgi:hypothetical protein